MLAIGTAILCLRTWWLAERPDEYLVLAMASLTFFMLPTQVGIRYFYPGLMFLALAMLRDRRLVAIFIVISLVFIHNIFDLVWLGIGLLYYPAQLLFWENVHDAIIMIVVYIIMLILFLHPLLRRRRDVRCLGEQIRVIKSSHQSAVVLISDCINIRARISRPASRITPMHKATAMPSKMNGSN